MDYLAKYFISSLDKQLFLREEEEYGDLYLMSYETVLHQADARISGRGIFAPDAEGFIAQFECLPAFATYFGEEKVRRVNEITQMGLDGRIPWADGYRLRIEELKGLPYSYALDIVRKTKVNDGVPDVIRAAKDNGYVTAIISGGPDIFIELLQKVIGADYAFSNRLSWDREGRLCGTEVIVNDKGEILRQMQEDLHLSVERTVSVGDGDNDLGLRKYSGIFLAFNPVSQKVMDSADQVIYYPRAVIPILLAPQRYKRKSLSDLQK